MLVLTGLLITLACLTVCLWNLIDTLRDYRACLRLRVDRPMFLVVKAAIIEDSFKAVAAGIFLMMVIARWRDFPFCIDFRDASITALSGILTCKSMLDHGLRRTIQNAIRQRTMIEVKQHESESFHH